ncbi:chemotaxis response regulator protein-glutamate methylesterase [Oscillospiraceae bacterium OttesenSCG-928-F05]|nr:chemotaxis response regulator protein-glutamate methylesterase [Oscillospiraceae bacterium OttesenSCG-928-F05]
MMGKKIRVLLVDDSSFFRQAVAKALNADPEIEVCAVASDPYDARDKIVALKPDVMTLDIEMPYMNGVEFLKLLLPQWPLGVIVVSSAKTAFSGALRAGAIDCILKPASNTPNGFDAFVKELIRKVKTTAKIPKAAIKIPGAKPPAAQPAPVQKPQAAAPLPAFSSGYQFDGIIALGASTGGTQATTKVLRALPADIPGMVIVQHMPPVFTRMYAESLDQSCKMHVREARDGDKVRQGEVLIAPGDMHMSLVRMDKSFTVRCKNGPKVNGHCPSVDVLFDSVASTCKGNAVGIILTGMGADGARGLATMRRAGAYTIGQDEASSVVYGMPKEAYEMGGVCRQAPIDEVAKILMAFVQGKRKI